MTNPPRKPSPFTSEARAQVAIPPLLLFYSIFYSLTHLGVSQKPSFPTISQRYPSRHLLGLWLDFMVPEGCASHCLGSKIPKPSGGPRNHESLLVFSSQPQPPPLMTIIITIIFTVRLAFEVLCDHWPSCPRGVTDRFRGHAQLLLGQHWVFGIHCYEGMGSLDLSSNCPFLL